jgi:L-serine dehydratase
MVGVFNILGPVMVGPSSSHTAGAVRIGYAARRLLDEEPVRAELLLHGSFAATGRGHGTDRALAAGLLGMTPDDMRIPDSLEIARSRGIDITVGEIRLRDAHPNTAVIRALGESGREIEMTAASLGGGRIRITGINGFATSFSGELPTLVISNRDTPGCVAQVTTALSQKSVNIAAMQLYRASRGDKAVMVIEVDQPVSPDCIAWLENLDGVLRVTYIDAII